MTQTGIPGPFRPTIRYRTPQPTETEISYLVDEYRHFD